MYNPQIGALIAKSGAKEIRILPNMANRHGLITGATGTGKTITLQVLAETFSQMGTPVFLADVKGDLSGLAGLGGNNPKIDERARQMGLFNYGFAYKNFPTIFWDVFGEQGHPLRATTSHFGPLLFSRLLNLNETQSGVLHLLFKLADDNGLLLLDLKDLRKLVEYVGDNRTQFNNSYGNIAPASIGAIQRALLQLESQGAEKLFGEPALELKHMMLTDARGRGAVNILASDKLMQAPKTYAAFLLWMLSELYETMPECGDPEKPRLVFFFDEAHLLFSDSPRVLVEKVEQVVRLVRSKGVGIYFVTQSPADIPENILAQLGNRIQHALRAYTPKEQKALKAAADSFRPNPAFNSQTAIAELGVGEALVSLLDEKGRPAIAERAFILPPEGGTGLISRDARAQVMRQSPVYGIYERAVDRESAYEILSSRALSPSPDEKKPSRSSGGRGASGKADNGAAGQNGGWGDLFGGVAGDIAGGIAKEAQRSITKSIGSAVGSAVGRSIVRGVLGGLLGGKK